MTQQIEQLLSEAILAGRRGDIAMQSALLDQAHAAEPDDPIVLNSKAMLHLGRDEPSLAAPLFERAAALDPQAVALWLNLAKAQRLMGDDEAERATLDRVLAIERRTFIAWLRKAELHQRRGEDAHAVQAWQAVLDLAASIEDPPADLRRTLDDARAWMAERGRQVGAKVSEALDDRLARLAPRDSRRAHAFVDRALGRRATYANQCTGVYYPFLPADEFFDREHFPWFAPLEAATAEIRSELHALLADPGTALRPYIRLDDGSPPSKWTPLDRSLDWAACFLWEYGVPNPAILDRCPATAKALAGVPLSEMPARAPTVFFSLLRPGRRIPPHSGVTNTRTIVHLPLIVPDKCGFRVGGETRTWREGEAFAFDDTIEHEAWNDSDEIRAVLILDVWNPHLSADERDIIARYFAAADSAGLNPAVP